MLSDLKGRETIDKVGQLCLSIKLASKNVSSVMMQKLDNFIAADENLSSKIEHVLF